MLCSIWGGGGFVSEQLVGEVGKEQRKVGQIYLALLWAVLSGCGGGANWHLSGDPAEGPEFGVCGETSHLRSHYLSDPADSFNPTLPQSQT